MPSLRSLVARIGVGSTWAKQTSLTTLQLGFANAALGRAKQLRDDTMSLEEAALHLGWPAVEEITNPLGGGPRRCAQLVQHKVGDALRRMWDLPDIQTGILCANPSADTTEAPLAIVIQFAESVSDDVLREAQRLCWNFSHSALLVTLEPTRIQAWSCALAPK